MWVCFVVNMHFHQGPISTASQGICYPDLLWPLATVVSGIVLPLFY